MLASWITGVALQRLFVPGSLPPCSCFGKHVIIHFLHYLYYVSCMVGQNLQIANAFVLCISKPSLEFDDG
jgi:hypothetical protein